MSDQNQYAEAIAVAEKLRWYDSDPSAAVEDDNKAMLYNLLGVLYDHTQRYVEAEDVYVHALEIRRRLSARNPEACEPDLTDTLWKLTGLYQKQERGEELLEILRDALPLYEILTKRPPDRYKQQLEIIQAILDKTAGSTGTAGRTVKGFFRAVSSALSDSGARIAQWMSKKR